MIVKQRLFLCATLTGWCFWRKGIVSTVRYGLKMCNRWTWFRRLSAKLSPRGPQFDLRPVYLRFVVDGLALGQVFSPLYGVPFSVSIHQSSILIFVSILLLSVNAAKPGNLKESIALEDYREALSRIVLLLSLPCLKDSVLQVCFYLYFLVAQQHNAGLGRHSVEFSRSRTLTHTHTRARACAHATDLFWTRDRTYTTRNTHKERISLPSEGFEPAIPAIEQPQTDVLDPKATGIGLGAS